MNGFVVDGPGRLQTSLYLLAFIFCACLATTLGLLVDWLGLVCISTLPGLLPVCAAVMSSPFFEKGKGPPKTLILEVLRVSGFKSARVTVLANHRPTHQLLALRR